MSPSRVEPSVVRRGSGMPVLAIHGNGVDHRLLLAADGALARPGGLERIYVDLPGFGQTPPLDGNGTLMALADWLIGQIPSLVGARPFALLANSLGGLLARHVLAHHREQVAGLALLAPVVRPEPARRVLPPFHVTQRDDAVLAALGPRDREAFTEMMARQTQETWSLFRTYALPGIRAADAAAMDRLSARYVIDPHPDEGAAAFHGPVLIVTGRQDHVVGYSDQFTLANELFPDATYACLAGAGHNVHLDQFEDAGQLLETWARELLSTSRSPA